MQIFAGTQIYPVRKFHSLIEMLRQTADQFGSHLAYMFRRNPGEHVHYRTYGELIEEIEEVGTGLLSYGLKGRKIAILSENAYEWAVMYQAIINGVGVVVPFDAKLPKGEIQNLIEVSDTTVLCFSPKQIAKVEAIAPNLNVTHFICMDTMKSHKDTLNLPKDDRFIRYSDIRFKGLDLITSGDQSFIKAHIDTKKMCALLYTSGTTSKAKGVMLSMENICQNIKSCAGSMQVFAGERVLSILPLHHTFETTAGMLVPLYYGACICINDGLRHLAPNLMEWSINLLIAVPLLIENIYKRIDENITRSGRKNVLRIMRPLARTMKYVGVNANRRMFKSVIDGLGGGLRMIVVGAAKMDKEIIDIFTDYGIEFYQGYGMTEHAPVISVTTNQNNVHGSVGEALSGVEIAIDMSNSDGEKSGEILVRSKSIMLGYYNNEEATKEVITKNGWLKTGDMGYLDETNSLHITGRSKSMIVLTNGKKAFPEEIEMYLNLIPGVVDSVVWGEINHRDAVDICAKIQIRKADLPLDNKTDQDISNYLQDHVKYINKKMPQYKVIKYFIFSEHDMIRTTTMKIQRHKEYQAIQATLNSKKLTMKKANTKNID